MCLVWKSDVLTLTLNLMRLVSWVLQVDWNGPFTFRAVGAGLRAFGVALSYSQSLLPASSFNWNFINRNPLPTLPLITSLATRLTFTRFGSKVDRVQYPIKKLTNLWWWLHCLRPLEKACDHSRPLVTACDNVQIKTSCHSCREWISGQTFIHAKIYNQSFVVKRTCLLFCLRFFFNFNLVLFRFSLLCGQCRVVQSSAEWYRAKVPKLNWNEMNFICLPR